MHASSLTLPVKWVTIMVEFEELFALLLTELNYEILGRAARATAFTAAPGATRKTQSCLRRIAIPQIKNTACFCLERRNNSDTKHLPLKAKRNDYSAFR